MIYTFTLIRRGLFQQQHIFWKKVTKFGKFHLVRYWKLSINFVDFSQKHGEVVLSLTFLNTIFPNGNFIFHVWHCVNNIRTCKENFQKLYCFIRSNIIARLFFTINNSRDCGVLYGFAIFKSAAASMLLLSDICFCYFLDLYFFLFHAE